MAPIVQEQQFARDPAVLADARRLVAGGCRELLAAAPLEDAQLLVTELLTNAIVHGEGVIRLRIEAVDGHVRFTVVDEGGHPVGPRTPGRAGGGWGLHFVDRLARDWGAEDESGATSVWFTLPRD